MKIRQVSKYVLAYSLWVVSSAVGLSVAWMIRNAYLLVVGAMTMGLLQQGTPSERFQVPPMRNAVDRFGIVILAVAMVVVVVFVEYYYRTGVDEGQLARRFVLATAVESGVLFVALAVQAALGAALGLFTIWSILAPLGVLVVTVALSWVLTRMPKRAAES